MKAELEFLGIDLYSGRKHKAIIPCELESLDGTLHTTGGRLSFMPHGEIIINVGSKRQNSENEGDPEFDSVVDEFIKTSYQFYTLRRMHPDKFCPQEEYIVEEISEFMKEHVKKNRGKSSKERLNEERADMIVAALNYLMWNGMTLYDIFSYGVEKTQRAIDRFNKNGEV